MSTYRINYNSAAQTALNAVNNTSAQAKKLQDQMSTGMRIIYAADDPVGLIKSETFRTQISGVSQAMANAQEGINYIKTADAQLNEITTLLQTARSYAMQASNSGTVDADQMNALNQQIQNNIKSINSAVSSATFGNKKLLDGSAGVTSTSVNDNTDFISLTGNFNGKAITPTSATKITTTPTNTPATLAGDVIPAYTAASATIAGGGGSISIVVNGNAPITSTFTAGATAGDVMNWLNTSVTGITATADYTAHQITLVTTAAGSNKSIQITDATGIIKSAAAPFTATGTTTNTTTSTQGVVDLSLTTKAAVATLTGATIASYTAETQPVNAAGVLTINGTKVGNYSTTDTIGKVVNDININDALGITATLDTTAHIVTLTSKNMGSDQSINLVDVGGIISTAGSNTTVKGIDAVANVTIGNTTVTFNKGKGTHLQDADGNQIDLTSTGNGINLNTSTTIGQANVGSSLFCIDANNAQSVNIAIQNCSASNLGRGVVPGKSLADIDLTTTTGVTDGVKIIDQSIKDVSNRRASLGSIQKNTLESAIRSLSVTKENLQSSESDIRNLDYAEAITQQRRINIINQSGLAQLAQANQNPEAVLNLLRG